MRRSLPYFPLIVSASLLIFLASGWEESRHSSQLEWREGNLLTWNDFKGKPEPHTGVDALSSCGIICDPSLTGDGRIEFRVSCYFSRPHSWVDQKDASQKLLTHEQGHFDIGELYARKLRRKLANTTFRSKNLNQHIQSVYDEVFNEYRMAQARYDRESKHSTSLKAQLIWEDWIEERLEDYKQWEGLYVSSALRR